MQFLYRLLCWAVGQKTVNVGAHAGLHGPVLCGAAAGQLCGLHKAGGGTHGGGVCFQPGCIHFQPVPPIAGVILTFIACYELIEMITQHNNMAQFEPALIMRWIFKTAVSVWLISNTFDIVMAVFDVTQKVVSDSSGIIAGNTRVNDIGLSMLQSSLMQMDVGPLFGLFLQSFFIGITMRILSIIIFVIVYGRMIEIYCMVSLAPIPMATFGNHEQSHMGQNYLKCLFALGFQGFLILICVAIYAVLIQSVAISGDAINSIWSIVGYTVLLCFSLFKTSSVTKSVLGAH